MMSQDSNVTAMPSIAAFLEHAAAFAASAHVRDAPSLYGITDGKAVGTYLEHKFKDWLYHRCGYQGGNSASGIDFPDLDIDLKVTSIKQPQSSCPFRSARQKIYGLGYHLLVFVYDKTDDIAGKTARLEILHGVFIDRVRTADYQTTRGLLDILAKDGNVDDIVAFISDRNLPVDDIEAHHIARAILETPPVQGYLTISNALQWRLQYGRVIQSAGNIDGIAKVC